MSRRSQLLFLLGNSQDFKATRVPKKIMMKKKWLTRLWQTHRSLSKLNPLTATLEAKIAANSATLTELWKAAPEEKNPGAEMLRMNRLSSLALKLAEKWNDLIPKLGLPLQIRLTVAKRNDEGDLSSC